MPAQRLVSARPASGNDSWIRGERCTRRSVESGMGDLIPGDVCVYPEKRTFRPARGLELPYPS